MITQMQKTCDLLVFGETTRDTIAIVDGLPLSDGAAARVGHIRGPSLGGRAVNVATYATLLGATAHILSACDRSYVDDYSALQLTTHANMGDVFHYEQRQDNAQALIFRDEVHSITFFYPGAGIVNGPNGGVSDAESKYKGHVRRVVKETSPRFVYCTSELHALVDEVMSHYSRQSAVIRVYSPGPEVQRLPKAQLARILEHTNVLFVNYFEMQQVQQTERASLAEIMRRYKLDAVVATLGHAGALLLHTAPKSKVPATHWLPIPKEKAPLLDATGAGDALAGGFLGYLTRLKSKAKPKLDDYVVALKYGMVMASFVIEHYGTLVPDLSRAAIDDRFAEYQVRLS
jgi:sugar/nucleoside kinase (ribokinase family)